MGARPKFSTAGLQHDGNVRNLLLHSARQFETSLGAQLATHRKFDIGDHSEQVVAVLHGLLKCVFVGGTEQNLRPRSHAHQLVRHIEAFANDAAGLRDQLSVDCRQKCRVIPDVIFHHQNHRNADGARVVKQIPFVFDVADDGNQNADVALPQEDRFEIDDGITRHKILNLAIVVRQHHYGHVEPRSFHFPSQLRRVHVFDLKVGDDQIEARLGARQLQGFGPARNMSHAGNLLQVEFKRLADQQFVEPAVFAEDERIVEARDQENVLHPEGHQVLEALEKALGVDDGVGGVSYGHDDSANS